MDSGLIDLGNGFHNVRGHFRIGGLIDVGTQCSLVKLAPGRFVFLDSLRLEGRVLDQVMALTADGRDVEAVLNLHPFHTVHCAWMAQRFPSARHYGSERHRRKVPDVAWDRDAVESDAVALRHPEFEFAMPQGIDYISADEHVHAGSLLAWHRASRSLHIDDTISVPPGLLRVLPFVPELFLHPTVRRALKPEPDAGRRFCDWADGIATRWAATRHLCAAHSALVRFDGAADGRDGQGFEPALKKAVARVRPGLERASAHS